MKRRTNKLPTIFFDVIQVTCIPRECISMTSGVYTPSTKFLSFFIGEIPTVSLIKYTVCKCATWANWEQIAFEACAIRVNVEHRWALQHPDKINKQPEIWSKTAYRLIPSANHSAHTETHAFVSIHQIAQILARGWYWYPLSVAQLVQSTVNTEVRFPILTVCCTSSHSSKKIRIDLDYFFDCSRCLMGGRASILRSWGHVVLDISRTDIASCCRSRVHSDNYTSLKPERKGCCSMLDLDTTFGIWDIVRV